MPTPPAPSTALEPRGLPVARAGAGSLRPLFEPRVVAVVGAGRERGRIGSEVLHNLLERFQGTVIPVNPCADALEGRRCYPRVTSIPGEVDLAVIAVPAAAVEAVIDDCIEKGVGALLVLTAGFAETGEPGRATEARLREKVRRAGLRMVGPNCMGLVNTDPAVRLDATFSPVYPPAGPIAFASQSGALGLAILAYAQQRQLGISSFVSVGNTADVSSNDLLEYWAGDPRTRAILLYLESFGNPARFRQIARHVTRTTPIVAVKSGRSPSGARAAASHTGALAASDAVVDALFRETGVIRAATLEELFDTAALLAHQPLPAGPRVAILTNAGGPGILAADACESLGLAVPPLAEATVAGLRAFLPGAASVANPVDMLATAPTDHFARASRLLLDDPGIDSLVAIFIPPLVTDPAEVARAIATAVRHSPKPVLATFFGAAGVAEILSPVPCYAFPEGAVRALAHAVAYSRHRSAPEGALPAFADVDLYAARAVAARARDTGGGWLSPSACAAVLEAMAIPAAPTRIVQTPDGACAAARQLGYPVAMKGAGPSLVHKTEAHAVYTNLEDDRAVRQAFGTLSQHPDVTQIVVQPMVPAGVEMFVGGTRDARFGPVVVCGSGGTLVELLRDTSCRLAPLTDRAAGEMLDEVRGTALLRGYRGAPAADEAALRDILLRVSVLLDACPGILELDINPVIVAPAGAVAVDARIRVAPSDPPP